jgi:glycosyltransferase involved in cell wall biosynthesis
MNLLVLDQFSDLGGAQQVLLEFLPALQARGCHALVGLPGEGDLFARVRALGIEAERIDCGPYASGRKSASDLLRFLAGTPRLAHQIRRLAARIDADLIYLNGPRLLPAAALARVPRPTVFHAHSYLPPGARRRITGLALRRLNARVVAQCAFVAEPWQHASVIYNGVAGPDQYFERKPHSAPRIACIGRISPEKGQMDFVAAAGLIHKALPAARFFIYGASLFHDPAAIRYEERVRENAAALPLELPGWVNDIYPILSCLDLLLVPSTAAEATTRVILEAFSTGLPVIAFRSGGIPEVIDHGVDGCLVDSVEQMAAESVRLLTNAQAWTATSRAARETWRRRFTLGRCHDQLLDALMPRPPVAVTHPAVP